MSDSAQSCAVSGSRARDFAKNLEHLLASPAPDPRGFEAMLCGSLSVSPDDARAVIYQAVLQVNRSLFPPLSKLELILTEGCNLACAYCFEKNMLGYRRMSLDVARPAVDLLFDYSEDGAELNITHFGGEPTLNFKTIKFVTEYAEEKAKENKKTVSFNTTSNGVLLDEEMVDYFARHDIHVLLSIDGLAATHDRFRVDKRGRGTFQRAVQGLKLLKTRQPYIGVKMTVMPDGVSTLFDDVQGLHDLGVNHFVIGHATGIVWSETDMENFAAAWERLYRWYGSASRLDLKIDAFEGEDHGAYFGCQAGRNSISVAVDGQISPCSKILGIDNKRLLGKLGDVRYGLTHLKNRAELVSCAGLRSACEAEGIAEGYRGGCFAANYEDGGDLFKPSLQEHKISLLTRLACAGCGSKA